MSRRGSGAGNESRLTEGDGRRRLSLERSDVNNWSRGHGWVGAVGEGAGRQRAEKILAQLDSAREGDEHGEVQVQGTV